MANIKNKTKNKNLRKIGDTWYLRIQWRGETIKRSLGVTSEKVARELRDQFLLNLLQYGQLEVPRPQEETEITFGQFVKRWVEIHKACVKYSTWRDYKSAMNCYVLPAFKDRPIKEITYMEIIGFQTSLKKKVSPKRVNNVLVPMRSVFDMAYKEAILKENLMRKVKRVKEDIPDVNPFSEPEIQKILNSIDPWYRYYTMLAFYTGLRDGELNGLRWTDYQPKMPKGPELHIRNNYVYGEDGMPKTKRSIRNIECLPEAEYALLKQKEITGESEYIFLKKDGSRVNPDHFREVIWKPALLKAKILYRPPIQTRHTFATKMLSRGEEIGWVQNMMGHSSLQMLFQRYYSWIPERSELGKVKLDEKAFNRFEGMFVEQNDQEESDEGEKKDIEVQAGEKIFSEENG